MTRTLTLIAALICGTAALAHEATLGDLTVIHSRIPAPRATATSAAGYMAIANDGTEADRLIGVSAGFAAEAAVHETVTDAEGVARMIALPALDIPAGDTVVLEPGGMHVMFLGLKPGLAEGQMLPATLTFEKAGPMEIEFMVDPAEAAAGHDHSGHAAAGGGEHAGHAAMSTAGMSDPEAISALLMAAFDKPEAPLTVAPITVQGDVAVAGWSQDGMGGRAFLRRDAEGWFVVQCSGDSLVQAESLQALGLSPAEAETLAAAVNGAEAPLGAEIIGRFNAFVGTVEIGRGASHGG